MKVIFLYLLPNWLQKVCVHGKFSTVVYVLHGVPQGSMLMGPFFLAMINDLVNKNIPSTSKYTLMFANHVIFFPQTKSISNVFNDAAVWYNTNKFLLNVVITQLMN